MRTDRHDHNNDPKHPDSWVATYDEDGNRVSRTYGMDPKSRFSWVATYDEDGNRVSRTFGMNPYCVINEYTVNKLIIGLQK